jgi:L-ascorbate metabolism protein UlaG (beta-lactamase superfamily)
MQITWIGHATVLVEVAGARLLTDPVLRGRVAHLRRHAPPAPHPGEVDAVLISHVHRDHLDLPSLKRVAGPRTVVIAPVGAGRLMHGVPFAAIHEVRADESVEVAGVDVRAVPAWHDGRRHPGAAELDALGYLTHGVWFAGDTDLDPGMAALRGQVEVALVPIWGWGPGLGPGHMDPERAAQALALVEPAVAVPIHWGTYLPVTSRRVDVLTEPAERFAAYARALAPAVRVEVIAPGATLSL